MSDLGNIDALQRPLPYVDALEARAPGTVRKIVIHATELPDLATARAYGERIRYESGTGNSGHYYIDRDGRIEQWVPVDRVAHHVRGHNADSIGIELVHTGRWPDWFARDSQDWTGTYPRAQIDALVHLLRALAEDLPALEGVTGHDALDTETVPASDDPEHRVRRKLDPGPDFPWDEVLERSGLPCWTPSPGNGRSREEPAE
ncbi:MAG: N-acetylmuramoyl-L-alanine amidase [Wenzhouxiangellaceae bacterium]|nr:N-acetylmuramoyl-L-alanine amidase [Wenzhouxiangellaceae bacterium]